MVIRECDHYMSFEEEMAQEMLESGYYPTSGSAEMLVATATAAKPAPDPVADRVQVYERLEQLHRLYEKGILNE